MPEPTSLIGQLRVLILSASPDCRSLVRAALGREPLLEYQFAECESIDAARAQLAHHPFDMIILDSSVEDVRWLASRRNGEAIVFLARSSDSPSLEAVVGAGAIDYFSETEYDANPSMLWLALRQSIRYHAINQQRRHLAKLIRDRDTQVVRLTQKLWRSAPYDYRTGWFSHPQILERLNEEMGRSRRYRLHLTVVLTEFQGLAAIETEHGKTVADRVLTQLAERLRSVTRQTDVVGHYGMDACMTVLTNTDVKGALRFCERIGDVFSDTYAVDGQTAMLQWYSGVCQHDFAAGPQAEEILKHLEDRVERAKTQGQTGSVIAE